MRRIVIMHYKCYKAGRTASILVILIIKATGTEMQVTKARTTDFGRPLLKFLD